MIKLNSTFKWSDDEQLYPLEKAEGGAPLYCQRKSFTMPNTNFMYVSSNTPIDCTKVYKIWGTVTLGGNFAAPMPYVSNAYSTHWIQLIYLNGQFYIHVGTDWSAYTGTAYILYTK